MKTSLLRPIILVLFCIASSSLLSIESQKARPSFSAVTGGVIESVYPNEVNPGHDCMLLVKGTGLTANLPISFGQGIDVIKPLQIAAQGRGHVMVRVSPQAQLGDRSITVRIGGRETVQPGRLRVVSATPAALRVVDETRPAAGVKRLRDVARVKPGYTDVPKGTFLLVGKQVVPTPEATKVGEFPVPFDKEMALREANINKSGPIWLVFQWRTTLGAIGRGEWQVFRHPTSYELLDAANPSGLLAKGDIPNIPAPGKDGTFAIDFRQFFGTRRFLVSPAGATKGAPAAVKLKPKIGAVGTSQALRVRQAVPAALSAKNAAFAQSTRKAALWQPFYVRIVLYGGAGAPASVSSYATIRSVPDEEVYIYPGAGGTATRATKLNAPDFTVLTYTPEEWHYPEDRTYRYIVMANCPEWLQFFGLKPGMQLDLKPKKDDEEWYEYIGEAVGAIIDSFAGFLNWVSTTWASLQAEFVNGICFGSSDCASLAGPALKFGLTCIGIPPEIPNFNQLCSLGADYLASYLASQVPGGELSEIAIKEGINKLADVVHNPPGGAGATYLWPDPAFQNKPPYITVELFNPGAEPTDGVTLWLTYGSPFGDSSHLPPGIAPFLDTRTAIPPLGPGQKLSLPIFLTQNPEIFYSHGNDNWGDYYSRPIVIYRGDTRQPVFGSQSDWFALDGTVSNDLQK